MIRDLSWTAAYRELQELARTNYIVNAHMMTYHIGDASWSIMLEALAIALAKDNARLFQMACDAKAREMPMMLVGDESVRPNDGKG